MKNKWIWLILALILIGSFFIFLFKWNAAKPRFVKIDNIVIQESDLDKAKISADVFLFNPGYVTATLLNTELQVSTEDLRVATISQTQSVDIPSNSEFKIPVSCKVDFIKLGMSQGLASLLEKALNEKRNIKLKFEGYCNVRYNGKNIRIPVTHEETVRF